MTAPTRIPLTTPCCNRNVQGMNLHCDLKYNHQTSVGRTCTVCSRPYSVNLCVRYEAGSHQYDVAWVTRRIYWTHRVTGQAYVGNHEQGEVPIA